eukprot:6883391-Prymnesium_polylepis.3
MTEGSAAPGGVGAGGGGGRAAPVWRSVMSDERSASEREGPTQAGGPVYDDSSRPVERDLMGGRAAPPGARLCTFNKSLLEPFDIRMLEMSAIAPPPGRYTPKPQEHSLYAPRYTLSREPRDTGLTRLQAMKSRDMGEVGPGTYFPRDDATRAKQRVAFFEGRSLKPPPQ